MRHNLEALEDVVRFIYDNIQYAEFNTKSDYCHVCGYDGEIIINDDLEWECPQCHYKTYLWISWREFLECRKDKGDQRKNASPVKAGGSNPQCP